MSIGNEILCSHARRIRIIDQHGVKAHILFPIINHNKWASHSPDQLNVSIHHLCTKKNYRRSLITHNPFRLLLITRITFIQIAKLHFHSTGTTFLLNARDQLNKEGRILYHRAIPLKHYKFHLAYMIFLKVPQFLCHFEDFGRCVSIHAFFII